MKDTPTFTNSKEIYDLLKPLGYNITFTDIAFFDSGEPNLIVDEVNDWVAARGGWPKMPTVLEGKRKLITVWEGTRGGGMSLSMVNEMAWGKK